MPNPTLSNWTARLRRNEIPVERRTGHGSNTWSLPMGVTSKRQPQDGAFVTRTAPRRVLEHPDGAFLHEPEDAGLTGGTRSLMRRLIGLNVGKDPKPERKATASALIADPYTQAA
jgi:hypothetical protein